MNICFFHGLESDGPGRKGAWLERLDWKVYAPVIDYRDAQCVREVWNEAISQKRDAFVGSSMGGWMATLLGTHIRVPCWLVNPAVIERSFEPLFPAPLGVERPVIHLLQGKEDELIPPKKALKWFRDRRFKPSITEVNAGHRIAPEYFQEWIRQILSSSKEWCE